MLVGSEGGQLAAARLDQPPMVVNLGVGVHGTVGRRDVFQLPDLWQLHLYRYDAAVIVDGTPHRIRPGRVSLIPPGVVVQYPYQGRSEHLYVHLRLPDRGETTWVPVMQDAGADTPVLSELLQHAIATSTRTPAAAAALPPVLHARGLTVPGSRSVLGRYSDEFARMFSLPYSSIESAPDRLGRMAMRQLVRRIESPALRDEPHSADLPERRMPGGSGGDNGGMTTILSRITRRYERTVAHARERSELVDHAFRAIERYGEAFGGRLAAAIAYYGFFATFAFLMLAYSVLGFLVEYHVDLRSTVKEFLQDNIPVVEAEHISAGRGAAGVFGLVGLLLTGVAWVEALRSSQRRIWGFEQTPGSVVLRRALDVVVLAVLAILLGGSFALAHAVEQLLRGFPLVRPIGWLFTIGVDLLAAMALMVALPRLRISPRRLLPAAVMVAVGIFLLNTVGRLYIIRIQDNPAYSVVATAAALLVYLYLFHQLVLLGTAWAASTRHGRVVDLAAR